MQLILKKNKKTVSVRLDRFPDGDSHWEIKDIEQIEDEAVIIFTRLYPDQNIRLQELYLLLDLIGNYTADITLAIPYMPYARQNASFEAVCAILSSLSVKSLHTIDCHYLKGKDLVV